MKYLKTTLLLSSVFFLMSSCSSRLTPFTDDVYNSLNGSERSLSKVQFYLSDNIVLYRELNKSNSKVRNGEIKLVNGRKIEEVVFKKGTPGVFVFSPKSERVAVSFEANDKYYLMFGPNDNAGGRFVLLAKEWNRNSGKVTYAGKTWNTSTESSYSSLMVDLDRARKTQVRKKTVGGRKI